MQKIECDHTIPLQEGGGNEATHWQLLCRSCHGTKTGDEAFRGYAHPLKSRFAPAEYKTFVESPKVLPSVFQIHAPPEAKERLMLGCVRCRRSTLFESAHPFPAFSPLDAIEERTWGFGRPDVHRQARALAGRREPARQPPISRR